MTRDEQEAFRRLTNRPELRGIGKNEPFGPELFYGCLALAAELLTGGIFTLVSMDWRVLVGTVVVLLSTLLTRVKMPPVSSSAASAWRSRPR